MTKIIQQKAVTTNQHIPNTTVEIYFFLKCDNCTDNTSKSFGGDFNTGQEKLVVQAF